MAEYFDRDGRRIFPHTEVSRAFQGRGLATILVADALRATREAGLRVVPACSMVADYIDKHPEFEDITDTGLTSTSSAGQCRVQPRQVVVDVDLRSGRVHGDRDRVADAVDAVDQTRNR